MGSRVSARHRLDGVLRVKEILSARIMTIPKRDIQSFAFSLSELTSCSKLLLRLHFSPIAYIDERGAKYPIPFVCHGKHVKAQLRLKIRLKPSLVSIERK